MMGIGEKWVAAEGLIKLLEYSEDARIIIKHKTQLQHLMLKATNKLSYDASTFLSTNQRWTTGSGDRGRS